MNIYTVTEHFLGAVRELFPQHTVRVLPEDTSGIIADLIVFTGGSDINPALYGSTVKARGIDTKRDEIEYQVLRKILMGNIRTTKVLGICRGLQLINVVMGGTLTFDIQEAYGKDHSYFHKIQWMQKNAFSDFLDTVNSMHHQCIRRIGNKITPEILGIEPSTQIIEAVMWGDKFLAFQFHPELLPQISEKKGKIAEVILNWVKGNPIISRDIISSAMRRKKLLMESLTFQPEEEE